MTMERLWAKNRVAVILTAALIVGMYIFWFMGKARAESMLTSAWGFAVPLILAALVGVVGERSGVVNIGIEGQMLISAFAAFFGAALTGSLLLGVLFGQEPYWGGLRNEQLGKLGLFVVTLLKEVREVFGFLPGTL